MADLTSAIIKSRRRKKIRREYMKIKTKSLNTSDNNKFRIRFFWINSHGSFSRRAFFFSLFGFIAVLYTVLCMGNLTKFNGELSMYILACNAAFGFHYYKNESDKKKDQNTDIS